VNLGAEERGASDFEAATPQVVVLFSDMPDRLPTLFDVTGDGRFVMAQSTAEDATGERVSQTIVVVQHWTEELKRLAPTEWAPDGLRRESRASG